MGTLKTLLLLACVVYAISQVSAECPDNPKCKDGEECCVRIRTSDAAECSPYLPENVACRTYNYKQDGAYLYSCPCKPGLYCVSSKCSRYRRAIPRSNATVPDLTTPDTSSTPSETNSPE